MAGREGVCVGVLRLVLWPSLSVWSYRLPTLKPQNSNIFPHFTRDYLQIVYIFYQYVLQTSVD